MSRAWHQIIGSIAATIIFSLVALAPMWIAETIEGVETARSGIKPTSEVITESNTTYYPYMEMNNETWGPIETPPQVRNPIQIREINGSGGINYPYLGSYGYVIWDYDGYRDYMIGEYGHVDRGWYLTMGMYGEAQTLLEDNINLIYIYLNIDQWFRLDELGIGHMSEDYKTPYMESIDISGSDGWYYGEHEYFIEITEQNLLDGISNQYTYEEYATIRIRFVLDNYFGETNPIISDVQLNPEYFQQTIYENETVYEPYILKASNPHTWTQWGLGFSGALFLLTAAVINPIINPGKVLSRINVNLPGRRRSR